MRHIAFAVCAGVLITAGCGSDVTGPSGADSTRDLWTYVGYWQGAPEAACTSEDS
jgi:hypothetical protein